MKINSNVHRFFWWLQLFMCATSHDMLGPIILLYSCGNLVVVMWLYTVVLLEVATFKVKVLNYKSEINGIKDNHSLDIPVQESLMLLLSQAIVLTYL